MVNIVDNQEILSIMGVEPNDLGNPRRLSMVEDITQFFGERKGSVSEVLKVLSKDRREDKLDAIWVYVKLQREKQNRVSKLNPEDFEEDIEAELKEGLLTRDNLKRVKKSLTEEEQRANVIMERRERERAAGIQQRAEQKAADRAFSTIKIETLKSDIQAIEDINNELEAYA